ncbi:DUF846-domain-containing protein [Rhizodiscina lignyota]|uniref:Golgi apparatus membrane protein TVP23 n=1 Tax=Rhizodiscina lignyota TaxID=1504668 RepID=A0A9P4IHK6_9PEZI|nr:DUF846-domain-containing protein [Rhizodiscina lignyota]
MEEARTGELNWRLSAHPITLITFLSFRIASLVFYLLGLLVFTSFVFVFIVVVLLLAADFYYTKNIAGRRLVGLRWWNEVDNNAGGDSRWVFESADPETRTINATDKRFFWLAMYAQPALWVALAVVACVKLEFVSLILVVIALVLTITNTLAFSRCDKFSQATSFASSALNTGGFAQNIAGSLFNRMFRG